MFEVNEGGVDRGVRVTLGIAMILIGFTGVVGGTLGTVLGILGFVLLITGMMGWCPLYAVMGVKTCRAKQP